MESQIECNSIFDVPPMFFKGFFQSCGQRFIKE